MKIAIVTALWQRPELTRIILEHYRDMQASGKHSDLVLVAVGSSGERSRALAESCGWTYVEAPNEPLSQKFNALFEFTRTLAPDCVVLTGSDDRVDSQVIRYYEQHYTADADYLLGLKDIYFHHIDTGKTVYFEGYPPPNPKTIGAGRIFSRRILDMLDWRPWGDERLPRGLDTASTNRMKRMGIDEIAIPMEITGGIVCDFKHTTNLTAFAHVSRRATEVDTWLLRHLWPEFMTKIEALKTPPAPPVVGYTLEELKKNKANNGIL